MKKMMNPFKRLRLLTNAFQRFPLALFFTMAAAIILYVVITTEENHMKLLLTCTIGAFFALVMQMIYERFFLRQTARLGLQAGAAALALVYLLLINSSEEITLEIYVRTSVAIFALVIAFIWVPVIKNRVSFNESFIAVFKAFFHTALYTGVALSGCGIVITTINLLIVSVSDKVMMYTADTIILVFAPVFFLSLIPEYPGEIDAILEPEVIAKRDETQKDAVSVPKFLAILIEFIIIPLTLAFTVILVIYIIINVRGEFWTNNLLEPMLVSYSITVIIVYILSGTLEKKFVKLFHKIFPKILVVIVLFQIAASILSLSETGVTHSRYFVIIFGIFAACAGIAMSILPLRKNGIIALLFIAAAIITMVPPTDAFSVSRRSQTERLNKALSKNDMLSGDKVTPKSDISEDDKLTIAYAVEYLERMDYMDKIRYIPDDFEVYRDFEKVFGFDMGKALTSYNVKSVNVYLAEDAVLDISGYNYMVRTYISSGEAENNRGSKTDFRFTDSKGTFQLEKRFEHGKVLLVLTDSSGKDVVVFDTDSIFDRFEGYENSKLGMTPAQAEFTSENSKAAIRVIVQFANIGKSMGGEYHDADVTVFIKLK